MSLTLVGALATATAALAFALAVPSTRIGSPRVVLRHPDRSALDDAGWRHGRRRWEAIRSAAVLGAAIFVLASGVPAVVVPLVALAPSVWIRARAEGERDRAERAVSRIIVTAETALRSGASLPDALRRAIDASPSELAAGPLVAAVEAFELGSSLDGALAIAEDRATPRMRGVLSTFALGISERLPRERLADLLAVLADRVTFEDRLDLEVRARAAGARQQQRILALLVPAIALYLAATVPTLASTLTTDLGRFVLVPAAGALEIAGIVLGGRVVRGVRA